MANPEHVAKLKEGVEAWNKWREENPDFDLDFREADLRVTNLSGAHLSVTNLGGVNLIRANLSQRTSARRTSAVRTSVVRTSPGRTYTRRSYPRQTSIAQTSAAQTSGGKPHFRVFCRTNFEGANLAGCRVYGVYAWDIQLAGAIQSNLVITPQFESVIQVDNLEAAQFIYLLLNNKRIRHVIDTITSKVVLILGRLTPERKAVLDAIREELRRRDYLPILFDFQKPDSKDLTGTVSTLANMARFIIADLTDSASVPHELAMIIPAPSCRFKQSCWKDSSSMRCSPILGADTIGCLSLIDTNPSISCSLS